MPATRSRPVKKRPVAKAKKKSPAKKVSAKKILSKVKVLGRVTHYYGHIGVAIVEVAQPIRLGDVILIRHGEVDLVQPVTSLQIDHEPVTSAKKKDVVGLKVMRKVQEGSVVMPG